MATVRQQYEADGGARDPLTATPVWVYVVAVVPATALLAAFYLQSLRPGIPMLTLLRDVVMIDGDGYVYDGLFSQLGGMLWVTSAAICLFKGLELMVRGGTFHHIRFMLAAGGLTTILAIDDLFLFHEIVLPVLVGVPELAVLVGHVLLCITYVVICRQDILAADPGVLLLGLVLFAVSVAIDMSIVPTPYETPRGFEGTPLMLAEDAFKFVGISCWTVFHIRAAWLIGEPRERRPVAI